MSVNAGKKPARTADHAKRQTKVSGKHDHQILAYKEAIGKTVEAILHSKDDTEGFWTLEIRFTDKTAFFFNVDARPRVQADYMKDDKGDLRPVRRYGMKTVCDW